MKYLFSIFCFAATLTLASAQDTRTVGQFDELVLSGKLDVTLEQSDENKIIIETRNVPEDEVNVTRRGDLLKISLLDGWVSKGDRVKIRVQYNDVEAVKAIAGAVVRFSDTYTGDRLELKTGSGAELYLTVAIKTLDVSVSEGGLLEIEGNTENQYVSASTGGEYRARRLNAEHTEVRATTGGDALVVANQSLNATANTGGSVDYVGDPEEKYTKTSLAGEIRRY